jgi:DNA (cytosine-5)-methyltransferase 1
MLTFGSLFAGIGGMDLGLERAGMVCKWQVEIDPYARRVLEKHWPNVRRWDDVRTFPPEGEWGVDLIAGGFPCQDISDAGRRIGIDGERSALWSEFARIIRILRPRFVLVENVAALLFRGLGNVVGDLAACGYDAEWDCIPAAAFCAPHLRWRLFLVAYANGHEQGGQHVAGRQESQGTAVVGHGEAVRADKGGVPEPRFFGRKRREQIKEFERACGTGDGAWASEPDLDRMAHGIPARLDRLRGLGNAVVPQVAEWIGRRIMEAACGS